ncbi:MAG: helix-turn-helix transcriptional regulator [Liquorilactobacillus hordei]|uniref:Transcriptional regulator n=1 Tax=Liquorilactobacillus hordei TaxID=468911 RepID=A0A3S6QRK6_9LACO|nr:helix-turn-helix transcriptional regulator [Liquorilactobacillus hordei]AUJ30741.1 transcriptional regulator [Liquorilactobacillus hordei]MBZ2406034.1 transcriptional regulator [Liquorilactobacillus hordei]
MKNNIYEQRVLKRWSQQKLAEACNVSRQTINAIEKQKYSPSLELAFKLAKVFDTTVDELFYESD